MATEATVIVGLSAVALLNSDSANRRILSKRKSGNAGVSVSVAVAPDSGISVPLCHQAGQARH